MHLVICPLAMGRALVSVDYYVFLLFLIRAVSYVLSGNLPGVYGLLVLRREKLVSYY